MATLENLNFRPGDIVKVWQKIKEGDKTRLQAFEGLIIARKHGNEPGATFTVRKMVGDVGVERIFPLYSPNIEKVDTISRSKVRRAKLYYIREKAAKVIRKKMKQIKVAEKPVQEKMAEEKTA
jgi:large subunit ribosomal protein L19